jgi:hypothetical protein
MRLNERSAIGRASSIALFLVSCARGPSGEEAFVRAELLATRNIEGYDDCPPYWDYAKIEALECSAVGPLLALLEDDTEVPGYQHFRLRTEVGDLAFFTLGELDTSLWPEVAYREQESGVFGFLRDSQENRPRLAQAVKAHGVRCRPGGLRARDPDKMCPESEMRALQNGR